MFSLPPARKEWDCADCEQAIYQSMTEKYRSGKYKVLNAEDGDGGFRNMPHVCPKRVGSKFHHFDRVNMRQYDYHQQHLPCVRCGNEYNSYKNPLCPNCFRLRCRSCNNLQQWIVLVPLDSKEWEPTACFWCGQNELDVEAIPKSKL